MLCGERLVVTVGGRGCVGGQSCRKPYLSPPCSLQSPAAGCPPGSPSNTALPGSAPSEKGSLPSASPPGALPLCAPKLCPPGTAAPVTGVPTVGRMEQVNHKKSDSVN